MAQFDCNGREITSTHHFAAEAAEKEEGSLAGTPFITKEQFAQALTSPEEFQRITGIDPYPLLGGPSLGTLLIGEELRLPEGVRETLPPLDPNAPAGEMRIGMSEVGISDEAKAKAAEVAALSAREAMAAIAELVDKDVLTVLVNDSRKTVSEAAHARLGGLE